MRDYQYNGKVKRKAKHTFTDEATHNNRSICPNCYEDNITVHLQPSKTDKTSKVCPECGKVYFKRDLIRYEEVLAPLGRVGGLPESIFEVSTSSRRRGIKADPNAFTPTEPEIPRLSNNMIDSDLEAMCKDRPVLF